MKIINEFSKEELNALTKANIEIKEKDYNYDEVSIFKNDFSYIYQDNKIYNSIVKKFEKIQSKYKEHFDSSKWKCKKAYRVAELEKILSKMNFLNKKVVSIKATGNDIYISKGSMVTCYNNSKQLMKNNNWELMKKITIDFIPDSIERSQLTSMNTPIILMFEDGTSLELLVKDNSKMYLSQNQLKNDYQYNIDPEKLFHEILNHKIISYEIKRLEKNSTQFDYMDKRIICDDNFYGLYLCFDNGYELSFFNSQFIGLCKNIELLPITIGKWKKCVKYYDKLFSKKAEPRIKGKAEGELTKTEKDLVALFKSIGMSKGDIIGVMVMLNATKNEEAMIKYLLDCRKKGIIDKITDQDVFKEALKIVGKFNKKK